MKAAIYDTETGEVLRQFDGPSRIVDNQSLSSNESLLTEEDVGNWPEYISERRVDVESESFIWKHTLSEAKSDKIQEIKDHAYEVLSETDWYITREQEIGKAIPQDILDHRSQVRSDSDAFEQDVNNLTTVEEVLNYNYSFPDPPEP